MDNKDVLIMYTPPNDKYKYMKYEPYHIYFNGKYIGCDFVAKGGYSKSDGRKPMDFIRNREPEIRFGNELEIIDLDPHKLKLIDSFIDLAFESYSKIRDFTIEEQINNNQDLTNIELNFIRFCYYEKWREYSDFAEHIFGGKNGIK